MPTEQPSPKIGQGHAAGMARQGLAELRNALYPEPNVGLDLGVYGQATPGEIAASRQAEAPEAERESSALDKRLELANQTRDDRGQDDKGMDRDI